MRLPGRPEPQPTKHPRKVRGGVRIARERSLDAWASQRWLRVMEQNADPEAQLEGLEYARLGQTRRFDLGPGLVDALIQGRMPRAYQTRLVLTPFTPGEIDSLMAAMADAAVYAAKLLSRELPPNIEDVFAPLGLRLFPATAGDIRVECTCAGRPAPGAWCKHACCASHVVADRLASDPTLIFLLRGIPMDELAERLRQLRSRPDQSQGAIPVYTPHAPKSAGAVPLEESLTWFWDGREDLSTLDLPVEPPIVSHPLLRRLGSSPFQGARFPLVGLLATCFEVISNAAVKPASDPDGDPRDEVGGEGPGEPGLQTGLDSGSGTV